MAYNDSIGGDDVSALIPEEVSGEILKGVIRKSAALSLMRQAKMSTKTTRMPVLSALPTAHFVASGGGLKQTSKMQWANKYLIAEEIAVIVPIPEDYIDDSNFDIWGEVQPKIEEAIGLVLDGAVLFGTNKPSTWGDAIVPAAAAAGNAIVRGAVSGQDVAGDVSDAMSLVENDGFDVNGHAARKAIRGAFRNLRDDNGQPIFSPSVRDKEGGMLWGENLHYVSNQAWINAQADLITGDWDQAIIATRQDMTFKILDQASIFDDEGALIYNFAQQDMLGMRVVARFAYQTPNPLTGEASSYANQYPFAVVRPVGFV
jgi:HK97 family phage major capsid protein